MIDDVASQLPGILLAYGVFAMGVLSPGVNVLTIMGTSMGAGRLEGAFMGLGMATGSLFWGLLAWGGLVAILLTYAALLTVVKIAGAADLLWLSFKAFRSAATSGVAHISGLTLNGGNRSYYRRGFLIQITNPKSAITWTATLSLGLTQETAWIVGCVIVAGAALISLVGHVAYAYAFSASPVITAYTRSRRWIEGALGAFLSFASYKLATTNL